MNTVDEVLDYAIDQEQQAADFYASMAERAEKAGMKKIFLDFARDHRGEQLLLGLEMRVNRLLGHAGFRRDGIHRAAVQPVVEKELGGGPANGVAFLLAFGPAAAFLCRRRIHL